MVATSDRTSCMLCGPQRPALQLGAHARAHLQEINFHVLVGTHALGCQLEEGGVVAGAQHEHLAARPPRLLRLLRLLRRPPRRLLMPPCGRLAIGSLWLLGRLLTIESRFACRLLLLRAAGVLISLLLCLLPLPLRLLRHATTRRWVRPLALWMVARWARRRACSRALAAGRLAGAVVHAVLWHAQREELEKQAAEGGIARVVPCAARSGVKAQGPSGERWMHLQGSRRLPVASNFRLGPAAALQEPHFVNRKRWRHLA